MTTNDPRTRQLLLQQSIDRDVKGMIEKSGVVYKLNPPKYFKNQTVEFLDHQGNLQTGKIMHVETNHNNKAYHTYRIRVVGWERARYVGEDKIQSGDI